MHCQWGRKTRKLPSPWDFITAGGGPSHGNMHRKTGKDRTCGLEDILADKQTDTQTCSSQYFATIAVK